ncbi:MAG: type IX secretion system outer membrane channel protein PorV [Bacteroidales bacterium]|nr:type IX secretion system outer membrane channel protein PorV [Bacteroidales bacterium]MBQ9313179.1 type IX secretion system outer membrane channel protein PorV [Bacteroidales bacterium]
MKKIKLLLMVVVLVFVENIQAQNHIDNGNIQRIILRKEVNEGARLISTGVPLLLIAPDSRAGALGDVGAASSPDANSNHWNAAKIPFADKKFAVAFTYSPWLRDYVGDIDLAYLAGYYKINDFSAIGASLTYFSLGSIDFTDNMGTSIGTYNPNEFAIDLSYSMKLTDNFSAAITGRYIRSDLTQGQSVAGNSTHAASAVAGDIGLYYQKDVVADKPQQYAFGVQISNLGNKISYSDNLESSFLPANLRIGGRYTYAMDQFNTVSFLLDFNKLLVPTPPVRDSAGAVFAGKDDNVGVLTGVFQSFYDAPDGFKEELQEINISGGIEYWYNNIIAARAGYFYESERKGARQYLTLGLGLKYNTLGIDVSYLIPTAQHNNNPLKNTLRVSLAMEMK